MGFTLLILGARHVPAAQVGLLALLEPVLGPIWAWFTVTEIPTAATLWGGLIILSAVAVDASRLRTAHTDVMIGGVQTSDDMQPLQMQRRTRPSQTLPALDPLEPPRR